MEEMTVDFNTLDFEVSNESAAFIDNLMAAIAEDLQRYEAKAINKKEFKDEAVKTVEKMVRKHLRKIA